MAEWLWEEASSQAVLKYWLGKWRQHGWNQNSRMLFYPKDLLSWQAGIFCAPHCSLFSHRMAPFHSNITRNYFNLHSKTKVPSPFKSSNLSPKAAMVNFSPTRLIVDPSTPIAEWIRPILKWKSTRNHPMVPGESYHGVWLPWQRFCRKSENLIICLQTLTNEES